MGELLPLLCGVAVGALAATGSKRATHWVTWGFALAAGPASSWINGELGTPWPVLFDTVQVLAAAAMTVVLARRFAPGGGDRAQG